MKSILALIPYLAALLIPLSPFAAESARILIVVGPTDHPPGTHEVAAGAREMQHCLENMANLPRVRVDQFNEWPKDKAVGTVPLPAGTEHPLP